MPDAIVGKCVWVLREGRGKQACARVSPQRTSCAMFPFFPSGTRGRRAARCRRDSRVSQRDRDDDDDEQFAIKDTLIQYVPAERRL